MQPTPRSKEAKEESPSHPSYFTSRGHKQTPPQTAPNASRGSAEQPDLPGGSGQPGVNRTSGQGLFLCGSPPPGSPALLIYCMFYLRGDVS